MKTRKNKKRMHALAIFAFLLVSCGPTKSNRITVILEEGAYSSPTHLLTGERGEDFVFTVSLPLEYGIFGASYSDYSLVEEILGNRRYDVISFHAVKYDTVISLDIAPAGQIVYSDGSTEILNRTHSRINVSNDYGKFQKDGFKLSGYHDDGGRLISLGSRADVPSSGYVNLTPYFIEETEASQFEITPADSGEAKLVKYLGNESHVAIPDKIEGYRIASIGEGAFEDKSFEELVLPEPLRKVEQGAFKNTSIEELVVYDKIESIFDSSFRDSTISILRINAVNDPCYIESYFGCYPDKYDRLLSIKDKKKIVLYSGSSTRFGFDSAAIDKAFPDYEVVNMGVYAYTESLPQIEIIAPLLKEGDIVIVSPEFDTLETQFNIDRSIDYAFFAMAEANFDIISELNPSSYHSFFNAFGEFLRQRRYMDHHPYESTPNSFDEDGNRINGSSYNLYGDYSLYRENNESRKSFGIRRAFFNKTYFPPSDIALFNDAMSRFKEKGATPYYDYSPRMDISLSDDSTPESIKELGEYLGKNIDMPFLSSIDECLIDPLYFFATDNHLSTEGVQKRTDRIIARLSEYLI